MNVSLVTYTPNALDLLLFTKQTRLSMSPGAYAEVAAWPMEKKLAQLDRMANTIASSWEFVNYVFLVEGISRACLDQLVRHRVGTSFAVQSLRAVEVKDLQYVTGPTVQEGSEAADIYQATMASIADMYEGLIAEGVAVQDARGVLPLAIKQNLVFGCNLRTLHNLCLERLCVKAQGEMQSLVRSLRDAVLAEHPWAEKFLKVWCAFHGTCKFPDLPKGECPVKGLVYNPDTGVSYDGHRNPATKSEIDKLWALHGVVNHDPRSVHRG